MKINMGSLDVAPSHIWNDCATSAGPKVMVSTKDILVMTWQVQPCGVMYTGLWPLDTY